MALTGFSVAVAIAGNCVQCGGRSERARLGVRSAQREGEGWWSARQNKCDEDVYPLHRDFYQIAHVYGINRRPRHHIATIRKPAIRYCKTLRRPHTTLETAFTDDYTFATPLRDGRSYNPLHPKTASGRQQ
ncbi:hypothetical protein BN2476_280036 [Paraburkholderia piptadeniae]|uniref:Uncharacterized protein n=1 Tax=Paraburkholderia piptadeniae TaxID=1701573 RepID=A0A1N7S1V2_9BURK|nr:hypothetical protein BN2476_280036 [Paraburkholderia piptadeniae]